MKQETQSGSPSTSLSLQTIANLLSSQTILNGYQCKLSLIKKLIFRNLKVMAIEFTCAWVESC